MTERGDMRIAPGEMEGDEERWKGVEGDGGRWRGVEGMKLNASDHGRRALVLAESLTVAQ